MPLVYHGEVDPQPLERDFLLEGDLLEQHVQEVLLVEEARDPKLVDEERLAELQSLHFSDQLPDVSHALLEIVDVRKQTVMARVGVLDPVLGRALSLETLEGVLCSFVVVSLALQRCERIVQVLLYYAEKLVVSLHFFEE